MNDDSDPMDDHGHGTNIAEIVASEDSTYKGIAYDADIVALKVLNGSGVKYFLLLKNILQMLH